MDGINHSNVGFCEGCVLGKQIKVAFGGKEHKFKSILEYFRTDV